MRAEDALSDFCAREAAAVCDCAEFLERRTSREARDQGRDEKNDGQRPAKYIDEIPECFHMGPSSECENTDPVKEDCRPLPTGAGANSD